jgi:hypothetical protein
MKVARLLTLRTGRHYPPDIFPVLISVRSLVDPRAIVRPEGLFQWYVGLSMYENVGVNVVQLFISACVYVTVCGSVNVRLRVITANRNRTPYCMIFVPKL